MSLPRASQPPLSASLTPFDRRLLRAVQPLVPVAQRPDWSRAWHAELWHSRLRQPALSSAAGLSIGLIRDALWLRADDSSRLLRGTPTLCLAMQAGLCILAALFASLLQPSFHALAVELTRQAALFMVAGLLVAAVSFATASRLPTQQTSTTGLAWLKGKLFFAAKSVLLFILTFFLSLDLTAPTHLVFPATADFLQVVLFIFLALVGMRWAFTDQEQRCKHCLSLLAAPARVGRPSRNLLEWNGTQLACRHGHGLLSVPELETSWCQSSQWIASQP